MKSLDELSRIESVGAKNKGKQEDKVGEGIGKEQLITKLKENKGGKKRNVNSEGN